MISSGIKNTKFLIKRAYARMELLRKLTSFTKSIKDRKQIYKSFIRSVLEQSCVVWNFNITKRNEKDLERVQKVAVRLILGNYNSYKEALEYLNLESLKERRNVLSRRFAEKCVKNTKTKRMFEIDKTKHTMLLRHKEQFKVIHAKRIRMENSAIPQMIKHLNKKYKEDKEKLTN